MKDKQVGFFTRLKNAIIPVDNQSHVVRLTDTGMVFSGFAPNWGINQYKEGYNDNEILFQALRVYLKKIKVAPVTLSKIVNEKALLKYEQFTASAKNAEHRVQSLMHRSKALNEIDSHSLIDLFNNPNTYQTQSELFEALYGNWRLSGNGYLYGGGSVDVGVNAGKFKELHVLPSNMVAPVYSNKWIDPIAYYEFTADGETIKIPKEYILHLKDWNPNSHYKGMSALEPGKKVLKTDAYNKTAQAKAFENGGKAFMVSSDSDNIDLGYTAEQADLVDEKIRQRVQGAQNYHNIFSITRKTKVQALGDSATDMGLLEAAKYNRGVISQLFGVDAILIGDKEQSTYANADAAYKGLVANTIMPDLIAVRDQLNKWLLPAYKGQNLYLDFDTTVYPELQPDLKLMKEVFGAPSLTEDERRNLFNYDNFDNKEWGQAVLVPTGFEPLQNVLSTPDNLDSIDEQIKKYVPGNGY